MIYYHGSDKKFEEFDLDKTKTGLMYVTPCKLLSQSYAVGRTGQGWIYTVEILNDEHVVNDAPETGCGCKAYTSIEHWNIIDVEPSIHFKDMKPVFQAECGRAVIRPTFHGTRKLREQIMENQEIIERLLRDGTVYPRYIDEEASKNLGVDKGEVLWFVTFPAGEELIGTEGFTWDNLCDMWREQNKN